MWAWFCSWSVASAHTNGTSKSRMRPKTPRRHLTRQTTLASSTLFGSLWAPSCSRAVTSHQGRCPAVHSRGEHGTYLLYGKHFGWSYVEYNMDYFYHIHIPWTARAFILYHSNDMLSLILYSFHFYFLQAFFFWSHFHTLRLKGFGNWFTEIAMTKMVKSISLYGYGLCWFLNFEPRWF